MGPLDVAQVDPAVSRATTSGGGATGSGSDFIQPPVAFAGMS